MTERLGQKLDRSRRLLLLTAAWMYVAVPTMFGQASASQPANAGTARAPIAEAPQVPPWQQAAGSKMAFDVASVRQSSPDAPFKENVSLDALDAFPPTVASSQLTPDYPVTSSLRTRSLILASIRR
jgi:hypothetical protein